MYFVYRCVHVRVHMRVLIEQCCVITNYIICPFTRTAYQVTMRHTNNTIGQSPCFTNKCIVQMNACIVSVFCVCVHACVHVCMRVCMCVRACVRACTFFDLHKDNMPSGSETNDKVLCFVNRYIVHRNMCIAGVLSVIGLVRACI